MFAHICHGAAVEAREAKKKETIAGFKASVDGENWQPGNLLRWEMGKEEKFKSSSLVAGG